MHLRYLARSDAGFGRDGNEDSGLAGPVILAVADGMGGHAAGEIASQAVVDVFAQAGPPVASSAGPAESLATLFGAANDRIRQLAADAPEREGMGTTATAIVLPAAAADSAEQVLLGHIGDSRAYLSRGDVLRQLTRDHTFVQSLVDDEQITESEARIHPARSVVTKVLQGQDLIEPDISLIDVEPGDRILICSDGLTDVVTDQTIGEVLAAGGGLEDTVSTLIQLALAGGGPDNVTIVLAEVAAGAPPAAGSSPAYFVGAAAEHESQG